MEDITTQPAGADNGVAGFSMKKTLIIAGCVCLLLLAVGVVVAIALLARGGGSVESPEQAAPELRAAPATALPIATALPAATDRPVAPAESPEQVAPELPDATATAVPTVPALPDAPAAPTVEVAAMRWAEVVRMHEAEQGDDPTGLYMAAVTSLSAGDVVGADVLETVSATSSFTTFCALAIAWQSQYGADNYKTVVRRLQKRLAEQWPDRDGNSCHNDLDWSSLTN